VGRKIEKTLKRAKNKTPIKKHLRTGTKQEGKKKKKKKKMLKKN